MVASSNKYEPETKVTSDLVVLDHGDSDHENDGGGAHRAGDVQVHVDGANGKSREDKLEWHRQAVEWYRDWEKEHWAPVAQQVQDNTTKAGEGLEKFHEETVQKPLGDAGAGIQKALANLFGGGQDEDDSKNVIAVQKVERELGLKPGPTIKLKCIDNMTGKLKACDIEVKWEDAWEDVLVKLKETFKRDVIFEYEVAGRILRVQDDSSFDRAMALAEGSDNKLYVVIQVAVWAEPPVEEVEPEEPEPEEQPLIITCADRLAYSPVPYKQLLFFGLVGLAIALAMTVGSTALFGLNGTYMLALSVTIPVPYFIHGFTVSKSQDFFTACIKCGCAVAGTAFGLIVIISYKELGAVDGMIGAAGTILAFLVQKYKY